MKKARANMHKGAVESYVQYFHTLLQITSPADLDVQTVMAKIKAASGANYGGGSGFSGVKAQAFSSYSSKEKEGNIGSVSYAQGTPTSVLSRGF